MIERVEQAALFVVELGIGEQAGKAEDSVERRLQFVAESQQEFRLRFAQRPFGAGRGLQLGLKGVARDQFELQGVGGVLKPGQQSAQAVEQGDEADQEQGNADHIGHGPHVRLQHRRPFPLGIHIDEDRADDEDEKIGQIVGGPGRDAEREQPHGQDGTGKTDRAGMNPQVPGRDGAAATKQMSTKPVTKAECMPSPAPGTALSVQNPLVSFALKPDAPQRRSVTLALGEEGVKRRRVQ